MIWRRSPAAERRRGHGLGVCGLRRRLHRAASQTTIGVATWRLVIAASSQASPRNSGAHGQTRRPERPEPPKASAIHAAAAAHWAGCAAVAMVFSSVAAACQHGDSISMCWGPIRRKTPAAPSSIAEANCGRRPGPPARWSWSRAAMHWKPAIGVATPMAERRSPLGRNTHRLQNQPSADVSRQAGRHAVQSVVAHLRANVGSVGSCSICRPPCICIPYLHSVIAGNKPDGQHCFPNSLPG